jgi:orotidine-5'-phosphate decarboxylase
MGTQSKPIIVALDFSREYDAEALVDRIDPARCRLKVGKELFTRSGPRLVSKFIDAGFDVFLDLKFHDIPNTVAGACDAAADLGCWMINVHASGGRAMLEAAAARMAQRRIKPKLIAVTVLTSMDDGAIAEVGINESTENHVHRLASLSKTCGMDGVVCSPNELQMIKASLGAGFLAVTPGVRPRQSASDDQRRIATPSAAIRMGADYLVIGRPITQAPDPVAAVNAIITELSSAGAA